MKARVLVSMSGVALFVVLAVPIRLAAQGQHQQSERAGSPQTGAANPVPLINEPLVPDAVAPGGTGFTLTVNGTGFVSGSVVDWNGSARATAFVGNTQLTATILASDIATAGTASVTVANASPGGGTSNVAFFPITLPTMGITLRRSDVGTGSTPFEIATGDFNRDGKLDVAVANEAGSVSILLGNGDGTFQDHVDYMAGTTPQAVATGDFNRDEKIDLAVANASSNSVSILLGNGDGTFQAHKDYATGLAPDSVQVGDFNGDGNLDVALANKSSNSVSVLLGKGDGTFQSQVKFGTGQAPGYLTVGDFNRDGILDLATANNNSNAVSVLLGNGDGTFQPHADYSTGSDSDPVNLLTADFNGDGNLDVAVADLASNAVSILLGNGDGTFQPHVDDSIGISASVVAAADFNSDGNLDLAVTIDCCNGLYVLLGNGDGTFQPPFQFVTGVKPQGVVAGDFDGDGRLDLAVTNISSNTISIFLQATTVTLSKSSLKFPEQLIGVASPGQPVTLTNTGAITLTISSILASGDFLQKNTCGTSVQPGASCTIDVSFKPTAKGTRAGTLTITDNAADSPQTVALTGIGTVVELSPALLNFGTEEVGTTTEPRSVTVTNTSNTALSISGIGIRGGDFGDFSEVSTCSSSLPAGASCTIKVRFSPRAKGQRQTSLGITDNGGGGSQEVRLAGFGL